jgi:trehalose synthase
MKKYFEIPRVEDYEQYVGAQTVERIVRKARQLSDYHIVYINSTYYNS